MVEIDEHTLKPIHELTTQEEKDAYSLMLELMADEILYKSKHPVRYWIQRAKNLVKYGDSTWDGAHYSEEEKYKDGYSYTR